MSRNTPRPAATTVDDFVAGLDHPLKDTVVALRSLVLGVDPAIGEEIKWNAPSFRTSEHFATMHLRAPDAVQLILHLGARRGRTIPAGAIADPHRLLVWLGPDRASLSVRGPEELAARRDVMTAILRQWIAHV